MALQFGVFDHIEPVPGLGLQETYNLRMDQIEVLDKAGYYAYHLAEHHTPAVHSLAPSQNVFLAAVSQRTQNIRFGPGICVLPLHHPVQLIEEYCMLDHLSGGRLEIGVGRGGVFEAFFWGQDSDVEANYARYRETLAAVQNGLSNDVLTHKGEYYEFEQLPMRLRPMQQPMPPFWYMRNVETAAIDGMNTIIVGGLDGFEANVKRYREEWNKHQGVGSLTAQGTVPKIGLVVHLLLADTDTEAMAQAKPAWDHYSWNLGTPRRLEAERRGLTQFQGEGMNPRPASVPSRDLPHEERRDLAATLEDEERIERRQNLRGRVADPTGGGAGFGSVAGSPDTIRKYMDEYVATGANYFVGAFQWGDLSHEQAMRSIELFTNEVMPHYV
jgi:alkanesulfonate monooxygenase SsuD/methylene tetrahydromethanopterin reductase-like flavin-dependent oxidoreductase (luciferase family)|tara:strand:- start:401 stop:1555 length:1155 start_codon:yes stop_codon:yes gene_type:complete